MIYKKIVLQEEEFEQLYYSVLNNTPTKYRFIGSGMSFKLKDKYTHLMFVENESESYINCTILNRKEIAASPDCALIEVTMELSQ